MTLQDFDIWFAELKRLAVERDGFSPEGIANSFDNQPQLYREYFDGGMSPSDALEVTMDRA